MTSTPTPGPAVPGPRDPAPQDPEGDIATVDAMFDALTRGDLDAAETLVTPDLVWLNTGFPTLRGRLALKALRGIEGSGLSFSAVTHHRAAADGVVLTDRTDVLRIGPVRSVFPVRGTFVIRDGRVAVWDDQFSLRQFLVGFFRRLP